MAAKSQFLVIVTALTTFDIAACSSCTMYGTCGYGRSELGDRVAIPCSSVTMPQVSGTISNKLISDSFKKLCPMFDPAVDRLCCDHKAIESVVMKMNGSIKLQFGSCPSCYANIAAIYCHMMCDPNQSDFVTVIQSVEGAKVSKLSLDISYDYAAEVFDSCESVKDRNGKKVMTSFCGHSCFENDFVRGLVSNFPVESGNEVKLSMMETAGSLSDRPLRPSTTPCNEKATGFDKSCECKHCDLSCDAIIHTTASPGDIETTTIAGSFVVHPTFNAMFITIISWIVYKVNQ